MNEQLMKYSKWFTQPFGVDIIITIQRVMLGALLIYHGQNKIFNGVDGMITMLTERGWPLPWLQAYAAAYVEFAGGVLLIVGLFTRPVATAVVILFLVIIFGIHGADPFKQKELGIMFLLLATMIAAAGPGRYSVDAQLFRGS